MTVYKKSGQRTYWKITDKKVMKVVNMERRSFIDFSDGNPVILCDAMDGSEVTESEFMEQFKEARDRIMLEKL